MMTLTAEEYAGMILINCEVKDTCNLARAIARVADKYAKWTSIAEKHGSQEKQHEAEVKREAYRLVLLILAEKIRK